jgi:hypothetical protein
MLKKKPGCIAALVATVAAVGAMAVAAAPAGATFTDCTQAEKEAGICFRLTAPFIQYHVSGKFVTKGGAGQTINLNGAPGAFTGGPFFPSQGGEKRDGFTGFAIIAIRSPLLTTDFNSVSINSKCPGPTVFPFTIPPPCGNISPPFTQSVEFPDKSGEHQVAGFTTEESPAETGCAPVLPICATPSGEAHTTAASNCPHPVLPGRPVAGGDLDCIREEIGQSIRMGYSIHGPGKGASSQTQSQCETVEPAKFTLGDNLTFEEFAFLGSRFQGSFNTPKINCTGKFGVGRGEQMTASFGGPTTYDICVQPVVPPEANVGAPEGSIKLEGCPQFTKIEGGV